MPDDLRARLGRANGLVPPDMWEDARGRAISGTRPALASTLPPTARSRVAAAALAFAVFLLAAAFGWSALSPSSQSELAPGDAPHETIDVFQPSTSMRPTIEVGQTVVVDLEAYAVSGPARGDIIAFTTPEHPDLVMLKRVIGLSGDAVEQVGGVVRVNGEVLREPYAVEDPRTLGSWEVDQGHVFVMGDDRPNSNDSRFSLGQISLSDIVGKVLLQQAPSSQASAPPAPAVSV